LARLQVPPPADAVPMTVKELIGKLLELPMDAIVVTKDEAYPDGFLYLDIGPCVPAVQSQNGMLSVRSPDEDPFRPGDWMVDVVVMR